VTLWQPLLSFVQDASYPTLRAVPDTLVAVAVRTEPFVLGLSRAEFFQLVPAVASAAAALAAVWLGAEAMRREDRREAKEVRAVAGMLAAELEATAAWIERHVGIYEGTPPQR
jgi:hypothetical protein